MKKFFVISLILILVTACTAVNASTYNDTSGMESEFAIERISYLGIVNGIGDGKFGPNKSVTRAELSKMIVNVIAKGNMQNNKNFSDINNHWGKDYILKAASIGILNGYTDGTFKPDREVSYAEAIAIIMRCLGYTNLDSVNANEWYENYILRMKEIGLNEGLKDFDANAPASRGDIAIILWNMISSNKRLNSSKTMLEEYFSNFNFWSDVKVEELSTYAGRIIYMTSKGNLYVDDNIDFSNIGGLISGFYDKASSTVVGMKIDEGIKYKKISGSLKNVNALGYDVFKTKNIYGYGDKNYAAYVETFVDAETDEVLRVVFYDTRESHFSEKIKVGDKRVTIESRDVYDQSIVQLKDGKTITYNILRTESVMDINANALLVHDGKIVSWDSVPNNSVLREIQKDAIYTYTNRYIDGSIANGKINFRTLLIDGKEYDVSDECICQNTVSKQTMKLKEGLTRDDIRSIASNDENVRVYLNEFDEIVKLEFEYDVWKMNELEEKKEELEDTSKQLDKMGFVTGEYWRYLDAENMVRSISVTSLSKAKRVNFYENIEGLKLGDFVYLPSGETKLKKVPNGLKINDVKVVFNYLNPINDDSIGQYTLNESSVITEVVLEIDATDDEEYSKCTLRDRNVNELSDYTRYKNIYLIVDEDNVVVRMYAIKEVGTHNNFGIVKIIREDTVSGEAIHYTKVSVEDMYDKTYRYHTVPVMGYDIGDLISFKITKRTEKEKEDGLAVDEVYRHENIGSSYDLIVDRYSKDKVYFKNSDLILDMNSESFEYDGATCYFDDFIFINARVEKNNDDSGWKFSSFDIKSKDRFILNTNYRLAINELSGVIVAYEGYKD